MVGINDIVINANIRKQLGGIERTVRAFEETAARLATGRRVNSALDNPQNFFAARGLNDQAADFNRRIDQIVQNLQVLNTASKGIEGIGKLIDQGEAIVRESLRKLQAGEVDNALVEVIADSSPPALRTQILSKNPVAYFPLDGATADNLSTTIGTGRPNANNTGPNGPNPVVGQFFGGVTTGAPPLYTNGGTASADFDGATGRVDIADNTLINNSTQTARTIELVFNADDIVSRQTLYEEGGPVNGFNIYVFNNRVHVTGTDAGDWGRNSPAGPNNINAPINVGETYHVALRFDGAAGRFEGFLNGTSIGFVNVPTANFPSHNNDIAIGRTRQAAHFDDILVNGNGNNFNGRISDVAIYNDPLTDADILAHATSLEATTTTNFANKEYDAIRDAITELAEDSDYLGINLLTDEDMLTAFNPDRTTALKTEGQDLTAKGLGLQRFEFGSEENIQIILDQISAARIKVREFSGTVQNDIVVLQTREDFTKNLINTFTKGSDDLTLADMNEEGAKQLATNTRLQVATETLTNASRQAAAIGNLLSANV